MSVLNKINRPLFFILLAGLILRVWGLGFGLPFQFHQDEPIVVNHALAYGTGDLNPHFFKIPPATSYLLFIVYGFMFIIGKLSGAWPGAEDFAVTFFRDPTFFYLAGRFFIGVVPGMLSVVFTYIFAKKIMSKKAALYACAIMAFSFINVINSHYIYTDMLLVLFVILAYNSFFLIMKDPRLSNYCLSGVFLGLAAGVKYNAVLLAAPLLIAHFIAARQGKEGEKEGLFSKKLVLAAFSAGAVFSLVNPFMLLDFKGFFDSFTAQCGAFWYTGWKHHLTYSLFEGVSVPVTVTGIAGIAVFLADDRERGLVMVSFPAVLYALMVYKSQDFSRYVLPLAPFIAMGCAYLVFDRVLRYFNRGAFRIFNILIAVLLLLPTTIKAIYADILFSGEDTRVEAAEWVRQNLPEGEKIACDSTFFRPAIKQPHSQLIAKKEHVGNEPGMEDLKNRKLNLMIRARDSDEAGYPIYFLAADPEKEGKFLNTTPSVPYDTGYLRKNGIKYVFINSVTTDDAKERFLSALYSKSDEIKVFSPYTKDHEDVKKDLMGRTCLPVLDADLFSRKKTGPVLVLYKIK